jgi:phosphate uptake regulator
MFNIVIQAMREEETADVKAKIAVMDRQVNKVQREVRKMVLEHLAISRTSNLLKGLQLIVIVIDLERIGDYTKNIGELIEMFPSKMDFGPYEERVIHVHEQLKEMFELTKEALSKDSVESGRAVMKIYPTVSRTCDNTIKASVTNNANEAFVPRRDLALVLLMRYLKRVAAHLKNASSAVVNPFPQIGYREGQF